MESKHLCPIASQVTQAHVPMQLRPAQHTAQALAERNVQWSLGTCVSVTLTRPRLFDPNGFKDIPIPVEHLDNTRVTVHHTIDGQIASFTDDFKNQMHLTKGL